MAGSPRISGRRYAIISSVTSWPSSVIQGSGTSFLCLPLPIPERMCTPRGKDRQRFSGSMPSVLPAFRVRTGRLSCRAYGTLQDRSHSQDGPRTAASGSAQWILPYSRCGHAPAPRAPWRSCDVAVAELILCITLHLLGHVATLAVVNALADCNQNAVLLFQFFLHIF